MTVIAANTRPLPMQGYKPEALRDKKKPKGGRIVGAGTGTSDSIKKDVQVGSYIMPADSTEAIGEKALQGMGGDVPVNVSNGEFEMPPEQVHAIGVQALDQMKNATHTPVAKGFNPQVNRDGEQFFNQGGQVLDEEEAKRKAARTPGLAPAGIALTPEMANANQLAQQRQGGAQAIEQTKQNIGNKLDAAGAAVGTAADTLMRGAGSAVDYVGNTTFDNRLPRQDIRDAKSKKASEAQASQWVANNPEQAKAAGLGMQGVADRATAGLNIPPSPLPGVGGYDPANPASPKPAAPAQAGQPQDGSGGFFRGVGDLATGSVKTNAGILAAPLGYAADGLRVGAANLFGGDANTLPGGRDKYTSMAGDLLGGGIDDLKRVGNSVQAGGRDLLGVQAAPQPLAAAQPTAQNQQSAPAAVTNPAQQPDAQQAVDAQVQPQAEVDPAQFAGMANNITRVGNSFSAQGPIREGYTINGQAQGQTNTAPAQQSPQNAQAVANLMERTPEFGSGTAAAGYQPNSAFAIPQQGGPRVTVVRDTSRDDRERAQLWNAASTAHKGAQNGQLTAAQMNTMRGLMNDERSDATSRRNMDANNEAAMARESMSQAGADRREAARRADQNQQFESTRSLDERRFAADQAAQGYQTRAADRLEGAYERYQSAETPEERSAAAELIRTLSGKDQAPRFAVAAGGQGFNPDGTPYTLPAQVYNQQTGEFVNQKQQQLPPLSENPAAIQIKNKTKLSEAEKAQQLRALGYQ